MKLWVGILVGIYVTMLYMGHLKSRLELDLLARLSEETARSEVCHRALVLGARSDKWIAISALRQAVRERNRLEIGGSP